MENENTKTTVAILRAEGKSFQEVGDAVGLSRQRASQIAQEPDVAEQIRQLITRQTQKLINSSLESAVSNVTSEISRYNTEDSANDRALSLKMSERLLETAGILKGQQSETVINIINNNNAVISPVILNLMQEMQRRVLEIEDD